MKYLSNAPFTHAPASDAYRENYARTFGKPKPSKSGKVRPKGKR